MGKLRSSGEIVEEIEFKGLPSKFKSVAGAYAGRNWDPSSLDYAFPSYGPLRDMGDGFQYRYEEDHHHTGIRLYVVGPAGNVYQSIGVCEIDALVLPNDHSRLQIRLKEGKWAAVEPHITRFLDYLRTEGWLVDAEASPPPAEAAKIPFALLPAADKKRITKMKEIVQSQKLTGKPIKSICKAKNIHDSTFRRWRKMYADYL